MIFLPLLLCAGCLHTWSSNFQVEEVRPTASPDAVEVTLQAYRTGYPVIPDDIHLESGRHTFVLSFPIGGDDTPTTGVEPVAPESMAWRHTSLKIGSPGIEWRDLKAAGLDPDRVMVFQSSPTLHLIRQRDYSGHRLVESWYLFDRNGDVVDAISTEIKTALGSTPPLIRITSRY